MINDGITLTEIAHVLNIKKSHLSYYLKRAKQMGYVKECCRDKIKILQLTQPGSKFVDQYEKQHLGLDHPVRLENIRFIAEIVEMPKVPVDWEKIPMHNWVQHRSVIDDIRVHLNLGERPLI